MAPVMGRSGLWLVLFLFFLWGCSQGFNTEGVPRGEWKELNPLIRARSGASAIVRGDRIYVIGGRDHRGDVKACEWTTISADGTIGSWRLTSRLNIGRLYAGAVAFNRYVYIVGGAGSKDGRPLDTVERAPIRADGSLGEWRVEEYRLTSPRMGAAVLVLGGYVYAMGGYAERPLSTIERARINPDGSLGRWHRVGYMPMPLYMLAAVKHREHLYIMGGRSTEGATKRVFYTEFKDDGLFTEWHPSKPLKMAKYRGSAVIISNSIYLGGGEEPSGPHTIETAPIGDELSLKGWKEFISFPTGLTDATMAAHANVLYLIGGIHRGDHSKGVYATRVD